ncbi:thiol reductant ABC exporter subunit CydD [Rhizobium sp. S152]|nr:thiol reductant ABC exporter subunit CydD [Rhizobium sp. S152]MDM9628740.1 thiol reductant ABC exporter subunit CydD [Rhizobium sp. S152]
MASDKPRRAVRQPPALRRAAAVQTLAALLWIPQAALLALSVGRMADGGDHLAVLWPALGIALLGIGKSCLEAAGGRLAFKAARADLSARRAAAIAALSRRSPLDATRPASGEAASVIAEQAEMIVPYLSRFLPARFKATVVPLAILVCVFPISWVAALVLLVAMPLIPVFMALIGWQAQAASEKQLTATGGLNGFLLDRFRGLTTIRSLGAVDATALKLRADADSLKNRTMAVLRIAFLSSAVLELFSALGVAMVAVYIGFTLLGQITVGAWTSGLDLTTGLFILLLAPAFFEPLRDLSAVWHDRASGEAAIKALDALSAEGMTLASAENDDHVEAGEIRLEAVSFAYCKDAPLVLDNLDLRIGRGEHIALLGASGSGKSTLLALMAGLAPPDTGRIAVGGRNGIAWIGQKPHIFAGTIRQNVSLGRPGISKQVATHALETAHLGPVAAAYGHQPLGDAGIGLSGGESLRLAIARAAADPDIRIILADEPTAHLDSRTSDEIAESLIALADGKTLVVATHDPRLAARMNSTIRLDQDLLQEAAE